MRKYLKKSLALFVSLMLSITCFAVVPFSAFADSTGIQIIDESVATVTVYNKDYQGTAKLNSFDDTTFATAISGANNAISRGHAFINPWILDNDTKTWVVDNTFYSSNYGYMKDGSSTSGQHKINKDGSQYQSQTRWVFDSGADDTEFERFYMAAGNASQSYLKPTKIELYFSNDPDTLFDASNKCLTINNSSYTSKFFADIQFTDGDFPTGRYVGIWNPESKVSQWQEIGFEKFVAIDDPAHVTFTSDYNAKVTGKTTTNEEFDTTYDNSKNLLKNASFTFQVSTDGGNTWGTFGFTRTENLYDGSSTTLDARADGTGGKKYRATIDLKSVTDISRIYVNRSASYTFVAYEIYLSNDASTLFNAENKVYYISNANGPSGGARADSVRFLGKNKPQGRYVGISTPNASNYFIFNEMGIEGDPFVAVDDAKANIDSKYKLSAHIGEATSHTYFNDVKANNLLSKSGVTGKLDVYNTKTGKYEYSDANNQQAESSIRSILWDGGVEQPDSPGGTGARWRVYSAQPTRATFNFGAAYEFSKIYLSLAKGYPVSSYSFYVSDAIDTLYDAENKILTYSYSGRSTTSGDIVDCYTYIGDTKPIGKYVGIAAAGANNTLYTEIGFEGVKKYDVVYFTPTVNAPASIQVVPQQTDCLPGTPYKFKINATDAYEELNTVKIGGVDLVPDANGVYTITDTENPKTVDITIIPLDRPAQDVDIDYTSDSMHYVDVANNATSFDINDKIGVDGDKQFLSGRSLMSDAKLYLEGYTTATGTISNYQQITGDKFTGLTDGKVGGKTADDQVSCPAFFGGNLNAKTVVSYGEGGPYSWELEHQYAYDYIAELNSVADIKAIVAGSCYGDSIGDHDIYVSTTKEDLFSGDPVATYRMDTDKWIVNRTSGHNDTSLGVNVWKTNSDAKIYGKYVGIRIWIGNSRAKTTSSAAYYYDRLRYNEFSVYGDPVELFEPTFVCPDAFKVVPQQEACVAGDPYAFKIEKLSDMTIDTVKLNGVDLVPDGNGVYTITDTTSPATVIITDNYIPADPDSTNKVTIATDKTWTQSNRNTITYVESTLPTGTHTVDEVMGNDLNGNSYSTQNLTQGKALPFNYHNYNVASGGYGSTTQSTLNANAESNNGIVNNLSANTDITTAPRLDAHDYWPDVYPEAGKTYTGIQDRHQPTELILDLGQKSDITGILLATNADAPAGEYELYIGDTYGNIFDTKPVATVSYTNVERYFAPTGTVKNTNAATQIWKTSAGEHIYGRYVAFKIYQVGMREPRSDYGGWFDRIRLCELAVFGTEVPQETKDVDYTVVNQGSLITNDGITDMLSAPEATFKTPFYKDPTSGEVTEATDTSFDNVTIPYSSSTEPNWAAARNRAAGDGSAKNFVGAPAATFFDADGHKVIGADYYTDFTFKMREASIKRIQVAGANAKPEMQVGHFALYVADKKSELYDDANLVVDFDNTQMGDGYKTTSQIPTVEFAYGALKGKYIGLRIYDPTQGRVTGGLYNTDYGYAMFRELNVVGYYGDEGDSNVTRSRFDASNIDAYKTTMGDLTDNMLLGLTPTVSSLYENALASSGGQVKTTGISSGNLANVTATTGVTGSERFGQGSFLPLHSTDAYIIPGQETKGKFGTHMGYIDDESKQYYDIAFKLNGETNIEKFAFYAQNGFAAISHYKFSVVDALNDAFTADANYNSPEYYNDKGAVSHEFTSAPSGRYIVLRIICSEYYGGMIGDFGSPDLQLNQHYIRMTHIYVSGTYANPANTVALNGVNVYTNEDVDISSDVTVEYNTLTGITDKNGFYPLEMQKATITLAKGSFRVGNKTYTFDGYYRGDPSEKVGSELAYVHTFGDSDFTPNILIKFTEQSAWEVKFLDSFGRTIDTVYVADGETVTDADNLRISAMVQDIIGYDRVTDGEYQIWEGDVSAPIFTDTELKALYTKSETVYRITLTNTKGKQTVYDKKFNEKITLYDEDAGTWLNENDEVVALPNENGVSVFFAAGNMSLHASTTGYNNPFVSVLGNLKSVDRNGKNMFTVFAHLDNIDLTTVAEVGINFTSKTEYNKIVAAGNADKNWSEVGAPGKVVTAGMVLDVDSEQTMASGLTKVDKFTRNFMATLEGISNTSQVTRYAQAYVKLADGETVYVSTNTVFGAWNY